MAAWDPNAFAQIVGRQPTQAETDFYSTKPTWDVDVRNAAGGGAPTTAGQYGAGYTPPAMGAIGPTSSPQVQPGGAGMPSYYNPSDPVQQAVMQAFQAKGIQPRDQADFQYWVNNINQSGGLQNGYQNQGGTGTWADRMASGSGGVGDYGSGGGGGKTGTGDWWTGQGVSPGELSSYGVPGSAYQSQAFGGSYTPPSAPGVLSQQYALPTQQQLEATPGYQSRLAAGEQALQRGAAAKGSILSGGAQQALARYGQDYASNEYNNLVGQQLGARSQNQGEFQQNVVAPGQFQYQNQYKQYLDEQNRTLNDYLTNYNINRTGVQDFLTQQNRTADRGLSALTAGASVNIYGQAVQTMQQPRAIGGFVGAPQAQMAPPQPQQQPMMHEDSLTPLSQQPAVSGDPRQMTASGATTPPLAAPQSASNMYADYLKNQQQNLSSYLSGVR